MKFLITGIKGGLGKFLHDNIPNSTGLDRFNFDEVEKNQYDVIIHCAFNKENVITNHKKYLDDNIFLTQKLKKIKHKKFIYISTIDVYQIDLNVYSLFKKFSESILDNGDLILRCSSLIGPTMKKNHIDKIKNNEGITLSGKSTFKYVLMEDIFKFIQKDEILGMCGIIDFIPNSSIKLSKVSKLFNSTTKFGNYVYNSEHEFINPIFKIFDEFNNSSIKNLKRYYG
jgi:hypothetical protein